MACLKTVDILLPADGVDLKKWAVIACDQFTSQPEYWREVEDFVGDAPSTLHMIYPEVYLGKEREQEYRDRNRQVHSYMEKCLKKGVIEKKVYQGYILTARETEAGVRTGLIALLDLEAYDYRKEARTKVRATEATVESRIPARVGIRQGALLEFSHVMMLLDDEKGRILEPLYENRERFPKLYDTELMLGGGRVSGYALEGEAAEKLTEALEELEQESDGIFLAVGDGNHSLAAAKQCWETAKTKLTEEEYANHPARFALVEVVNLHDPSMAFRPIHRVLFGAYEKTAEKFEEYLSQRVHIRTERCVEGDADIIFLQGELTEGIRFADKGKREGSLAVELLQNFLDEYLAGRHDAKIDYVHSEKAVRRFAKMHGTCGMLLRGMDKSRLFPAIAAGGALPRKTFSIGEDCQKRYYIECRRVRERVQL